MSLELDLLDEKRKQAAVKTTQYKDQAAKLYNKNICHHQFMVGNLVLRQVFQNTQYPILTNWLQHAKDFTKWRTSRY